MSRERKTIEINDFRLYYDGLYKIKFEYQNETYKFYIYLSPDMLYKIITNEKIENELLQEIDYTSNFEHHFTKTTLVFETFDEEHNSLITSERADYLQDKGIYLIHCEIKKD